MLPYSQKERKGGRKGDERFLLCVSGMSEKLLGKKRAQQGGKGDPDLPELRQGNATGTVFCLEVNTMLMEMADFLEEDD